MKPGDDHIYAIFGASGDLTKRKLVPALYSLFMQKLLPDDFALVGVSRSRLSVEEFRDYMKSAITEFKEIDDDSGIGDFVRKLYYKPILFDEVSSYGNSTDYRAFFADNADRWQHGFLPFHASKPVRHHPAAPGGCGTSTPGGWLETADHRETFRL